MDKERFLVHAKGAMAIIVLVLLTNEGYRHYRGLADSVTQSRQDIAKLQRDLYVLQVQLDNGASPGQSAPTSAPVVTAAAPAHLSATLPMPAPMASVLSLPEPPAQPRAKAQPSDEPKSMVSVVLMSEAKAAPATSGASAKQAASPKVDVQLIGDSK